MPICIPDAWSYSFPCISVYCVFSDFRIYFYLFIPWTDIIWLTFFSHFNLNYIYWHQPVLPRLLTTKMLILVELQKFWFSSTVVLVLHPSLLPHLSDRHPKPSRLSRPRPLRPPSRRPRPRSSRPPSSCWTRTVSPWTGTTTPTSPATAYVTKCLTVIWWAVITRT